MPEEECKDEADAEAHPPSDEEEGAAAEVLELPQHHHPLGQLAHRLRVDLRLWEEGGSCDKPVLEGSDVLCMIE